MMRQKHGTLHIVEPVDLEAPVPLTRIAPKGPIRLVFWGLRAYILVMLALVAIGFARGLH
ncbi:MAG: hypothetical protein M0Z53_10615 [Thermaerobacter sp.]|nr:hypothetical protein [Thermaerobacter sp.]